MRFALVCVDLDGTLVDSERDISEALATAFAAVPSDDADEVARTAHMVARAGLGRPLREIYDHARPRRGDDYARFADAYMAHYSVHLVRHTRPFPGVVETLRALQPARADGLKLAVATTKRTETARRVCRELALFDFFDAVVGSDTLPPKPAPDVLWRCAELTGADSARGLMVGDTAGDILAGKAAGMRTCAVSTGVISADELRALAPDWLLPRFADVLSLLGERSPR